MVDHVWLIRWKKVKNAVMKTQRSTLSIRCLFFASIGRPAVPTDLMSKSLAARLEQKRSTFTSTQQAFESEMAEARGELQQAWDLVLARSSALSEAHATGDIVRIVLAEHAMVVESFKQVRFLSFQNVDQRLTDVFVFPGTEGPVGIEQEPGSCAFGCRVASRWGGRDGRQAG